MAGAEYLSYYPPWGDYRLGRVNYEDLEFTLSNLRGGDSNKTIGEAEVMVMEVVRVPQWGHHMGRVRE